MQIFSLRNISTVYDLDLYIWPYYYKIPFTEQWICTLILTWLIPMYLLVGLDVYIVWIPLPFRRVTWAFKTNTLYVRNYHLVYAIREFKKDLPVELFIILQLFSTGNICMLSWACIVLNNPVQFDLLFPEFSSFAKISFLVSTSFSWCLKYP